MDSFLGIAGLDVNDVEETHWTVEASVNATDRAVCRLCGPHGRMESKGKAKPKRVMDTPTRGKPTALTIHRKRFLCLVCGASVTDPGPLVDDRRRATLRLIRYIQNQVTKHPIAHVARETGMPASTVRDIALDLARSLEEHHRFPTPRVLGMDGLKLNGVEYMVIGDADSGHLIGIAQQASTAEVRRWMKAHAFDTAAVEVFVTDMHSVNVSLARKELKGSLHVADKWHILKNFQASLSRIVDKAVHDLRAGNERESITPNTALAQDIDDLKPAIMSVNHARLRRRRRHKKGEQMALDFGRDLKPYLDRVESISRAYWARYDLISMYQCETEREALA